MRYAVVTSTTPAGETFPKKCCFLFFVNPRSMSGIKGKTFVLHDFSTELTVRTWVRDRFDCKAELAVRT